MSIMAPGRFVSYDIETGSDLRNLGRWMFLLLRNVYKTVRVIMAYRPCKSHPIRRRGKGWVGGLSWEQHDRYFRSLGRFH